MPYLKLGWENKRNLNKIEEENERFSFLTIKN